METNVDTTNVATRRSMLKGLGALASAIAIVAPAAAAQPEVSPELKSLLMAYAETQQRLSAADEALSTASRVFDETMRKANLRVGMTYRTVCMGQRPIMLDGDTSPDWVRQHIEETFAGLIASAEAAAERQPEMAPFIVSPDEYREAHAKVRANAEPVLAEYDRLFRASGLPHLDDEAQDAYDAAHAARKALFAFQPRTLADAQAVARTLWQAAEASGHWAYVPTRDFLVALCPDLGA
jgi:hypothetical protein